MLSSSSWRGLIPQLFLITILPLTLLLLGITFGSLSVHQNAMRMLVAERDQRAVRTMAQALEGQIRQRTYALRSLALAAPNKSAAEWQALLASASFLLPDFDGGLALLSPQGYPEAASGNWTGWDRLGESLLPVLQKSLSEASPGVASFIHPEQGERYVLVFMPVSGGDVVIAGAYAVANLVQTTLGEDNPTGALWIVDQTGALVYSSGPAPSGEPLKHPGVAEALNGKSGTTYLQVGQDEHVIAYSPLPSMGWALLIEDPWEQGSTPTQRMTQVAPLVLVPVLLLALLALWFGVRQVVQPLQRLEAQAAELAWGDFQAIEKPVQGIPEIRRLQGELIHLARKVQAAQKGLRGYIGAMTLAQEVERRRLSHELHDDTLQALIALKQRVQLAQMKLQNQDSAQSLAEIVSLTEQTIANLRRLTRALRPVYLEDLGLVTALKMLAQETSQISGIAVDFQRIGEERRLPPEVELALYRMAQEALSNVARHAQARAAWVRFTFAESQISLEVVDNGVGFQVPKSPAEFVPSGHFGLLGLYERAELIGAKLKIQSVPGKGTHLTVELPTSHFEAGLKWPIEKTPRPPQAMT